MPIYTSCFARAKLIPPPLRPVSIARWPPRFWKGERYYPLAPSADLLRRIKAGAVSWDEYCDQYAAQLAALDPAAAARDLEGAVLLCFEAQGEPCHRRLAAEWLETALGIEVPEWTPPAAVAALKALTIKPQFATAIMQGEKTVEYRSWPTRWRGLLLVHAAKPLGALLGSVQLVDCVGEDRDWEWMLDDPRPLTRPIPMMGKLGLWSPEIAVACQHCSFAQPIAFRQEEAVCVQCRRPFRVEW